MINKRAIELNEIIKQESPQVHSMLSEKGRALYFPKGGILAQGAEAKGKDINATVGIALEEDGSPLALESVKELIKLKKSEVFSYAPSAGLPALRKKWKEMILQKNPGINDEISVPIVTNALSHGLVVAGYLFSDGESIVAEPFWGNYNLIFETGYNSKLVKYPIFSDEGYNVSQLDVLLNAEGDKKIVIFNFPNNPTGYTPLEEEIDKIVEVVKNAAENGKKIVALCDDAYFGLVYEPGVYKESIFSKLSSVHVNVMAVKIDGATKEDYAWGLRTGFITFGIKNGSRELYQALEEKTAGAVRGTISSASHPSQSLLLRAYNEPEYHKDKEEKYNLLKTRYNKLKETLKKYDNRFFEPLPCNSGYFMCLRLKNIDAEKVRKLLLEKYSTGVIAIGNVLRIAFSATPLTKIEQMVKNIYSACEEING